MELSHNVISTTNNLGLQNNLAIKTVGTNLGLKANNNSGAYYAKKGEPMYMKEMDADEDGVVSFDEFKDYCKSNGISTKEMLKMAELANSYRTMQRDKKIIKEVANHNKSENSETSDKSNGETVYARRGDGKYDEKMDTNNDDKVSYKEYIEYCKEHSNRKEQKSETKVEENADGELKISNPQKAINTYNLGEVEPEVSYTDNLV